MSRFEDLYFQLNRSTVNHVGRGLKNLEGHHATKTLLQQLQTITTSSCIGIFFSYLKSVNKFSRDLLHLNIQKTSPSKMCTIANKKIYNFFSENGF